MNLIRLKVTLVRHGVGLSIRKGVIFDGGMIVISATSAYAPGVSCAVVGPGAHKKKRHRIVRGTYSS